MVGSPAGVLLGVGVRLAPGGGVLVTVGVVSVVGVPAGSVPVSGKPLAVTVTVGVAVTSPGAGYPAGVAVPSGGGG